MDKRKKIIEKLNWLKRYCKDNLKYWEDYITIDEKGDIF